MESSKKCMQQKLLDMIEYLDAFCRENQIEYYMICGSCLGAVRHQGFIPWDDDLDIGMTLENYNKFNDACRTKLDTTRFFWQTLETEPNYYLSFGKIRDIHTTLIDEYNKDIPMTYGVYIDVFPLVGVPEGKFARGMQKVNRALAMSANINIINNRFLYHISRAVIRLFGKKHVLSFCTKQATKYSCEDHEIWCSIFDGDNYDMSSTTRSIMGRPTYVPFENLMLPIPEHYDEYLKHLYGDYMQLPPPEKRKEHTPYIMDLEHSYEEYLALQKNETVHAAMYN